MLFYINLQRLSCLLACFLVGQEVGISATYYFFERKKISLYNHQPALVIIKTMHIKFMSRTNLLYLLYDEEGYTLNCAFAVMSMRYNCI